VIIPYNLNKAFDKGFPLKGILTLVGKVYKGTVVPTIIGRVKKIRTKYLIFKYREGKFLSTSISQFLIRLQLLVFGHKPQVLKH